MRHGKTPSGHRHPIQANQLLDHIEVLCRLQNGVTVALDDVLHLGVLEQVTGTFRGAGGAVSGLYGCGPAVTATGYVGVGEACLFFVDGIDNLPDWSGVLSVMQGSFPRAANSRTGSRVTRMGYQLRGWNIFTLNIFWVISILLLTP